MSFINESAEFVTQIIMSVSLLYDNLAVFPIAVPLFLGGIMILLRNHPKIQKKVDLTGSLSVVILATFLLLSVIAKGPVAYDVGEFGKYGIVLVGDMLSASMVFLTSVISLLCLFYSYDYIESKSLNQSYHSLFNLLLAGLNGIFLTGDIFNLFVFFEIMFLASIALILSNEKHSSTLLTHKFEGTFKYMVLGMIGSLFMLIAIVTTYGTIGSLNMADIAAKISVLAQEGRLPWQIVASGLLFILVFGNKAALVPLHYWLPDVHPTAPTPISAMLSGILIKVGIYGIMRIVFLIYAPASVYFLPILLFFSLITIVVGAVGALGQKDLKRILAYSSVSQIGYVLLGLSIGTPETIAAAFAYMIFHAVAKSMLFLTAGGIIHHTGTRDIRKMGGLIKSLPFYSGAFFLGAMSIAGFPPLCGFFSKMYLLKAGLSAGAFIAVGIALVAAFATIFYMFGTWISIFWGQMPDTLRGKEMSKSREIVIPIFILCAVAVLLGIFCDPVFRAGHIIAAQIIDPELYISTVLEVIPR